MGRWGDFVTPSSLGLYFCCDNSCVNRYPVGKIMVMPYPSSLLSVLADGPLCAVFACGFMLPSVDQLFDLLDFLFLPFTGFFCSGP